jgi:hypothetical protein
MSTDILASCKQTKRERWGRCAATAPPLPDWWRAMTGGSELVEFVLQCLLIGSRIPAFEREETMSFMWKVQGTATKSPPLTGTMKG